MMEWASRTRRFDFAFAWLAPLLLLLSFLPTASVGYVESSVLATLLALLAALFCAADVFRAAAPKARPAWFARVLALLLLLWCLFQIVLPACFLPGWMRWQGPADLLSDIAAHSRFPLPLAVNPHASVHALLLWSALAFFSVAASRRLFHSRPRFVFLSLFVSAAFLEALYAIFFRDSGTPRIHGHFANADAFAGLLAMSSSVTLGLLLASCLHEAPRGSRSFARWLAGRSSFGAAPFWIAALLVQWGAIFASGSRGAALAALVAALVLLVPAAVTRPFLRRALLLSLPLLIALGVLFQHNALRQNVLERAQSGGVVSQTIPRTTIWKAAVRFVHEFPAGAGPDGMRHFLSHYQDPARHGALTLDYAHNDTLQFLGDLGIPGFTLLLLLLLFLAVRAVRACRALPYDNDNRLSSSPWILRGCAAALVAAILHVQVEFNLSARPPLQLSFLLLAAVLVSAGRPRPEKSSAPPHLSFLFAVLLALAALAASATLLSSAFSYRLCRSVATAADIPPPPTDTPLLDPAPASPDDAPARLDRAARLDPLSPFVPLTRARLPLALQRHDLQNAAAALSPDDPENEEALARLALVFRPEETIRLRQASEAADLAVAAAPWDPTPLTLRAWILLRGVAIGLFPPEAADQALDDIRLAIALSPAESRALADAAQAFRFAVASSPGNLDRLFEMGSRIIALNPSLTDDVLALWWSAGASLDRIFTLAHLPTDCLWHLYRLNADAPAADRFAILDRIETSLDDPVLYPPESPDSPWLPPVRPSASPETCQKHRERLAGERLRLRASLGDLPAIADSAPERASERTRRSERQWVQVTSSDFSRPIQLANIRRLFDARTLTPPYRARAALALLEIAPRDPAVLAAIQDAATLGCLPDGAETALALLPPSFSLHRNAPAPLPAPDDTLDIPYLGESVVLDALSIAPSTPSSASLRVNSSWRFRATSLPPNLAVSFNLYGEGNRHIATRTAVFESNCPSYFRGNPDFSQPAALSLPLPKTARLARTIRVSLFAGKTFFYPDDIRAALVFDAAPLFPAPAADPDTTPAVPRQKKRHKHSSAKPQPEPEPEASPEPTLEAGPETASETTPEPTPASHPEPAPQAEPASEKEATAESALEPSPASESKPSTEPEPSPAPQSEPASTPEPERAPAPEQESNPVPPPDLLLDPELADAMVPAFDPELEAEFDREIASSLADDDDDNISVDFTLDPYDFSVAPDDPGPDLDAEIPPTIDADTVPVPADNDFLSLPPPEDIPAEPSTPTEEMEYFP